MQTHRQAGFTLMELVVVTGLLGLLATLLVPGLTAAMERGRVASVYSDLRQIETALMMYYARHQHYPPVRVSCNTSELSHWCHLPPELAEEGLLPPARRPGLTSALEDPFNPRHTYKYAAPGPYYLNDSLQHHGFSMYVPDDFPNNYASGGAYHDTSDSPLAWVVWSMGPRAHKSKALHGRAPVSAATWYEGPGDHGVIARIQHREGGTRQTP